MVKKGAGSSSPNKRTMAILNQAGLVPWMVQSRITPIISRDLYNLIDILAYGSNNRIYGIQATSRNSRTDHIDKMLNNEHLEPLINCGLLVELWCYWQRKGQSAILLSIERFRIKDYVVTMDELYYDRASEVHQWLRISQNESEEQREPFHRPTGPE